MQQRRIRRHQNILKKLNSGILPIAAALVLNRGQFVLANTPATWEGTAGDNLWTSPTNWSINAPPPTASPYDDLTFGNGTPGTISLNGNQFANSLTFSTNGFTLDAPSSTNILTDSTGAITVGPSSVTATINSILTGSAGLVLSGTGDLVLNGADTYSGGTVISGGTLTTGNATAINTAAQLTVSSAGSLVIGANTTLALGSGVSNSGNFTVSNSDTFTFNTSGAVFTQTAGTLTVNGTLNTAAAGFTYNGGSIVGTVQIGTTTFAPTLTFGSTAGNSGTFIIGGKGVTFSAVSSGIQSNQTVTLAPTASAGGAMTTSTNLTNAGNLTLDGSSTSSATLSTTTSHTLTNTGTLTTTSSATPSTLTDFITTGTLNNTSAGTVNVDASLTVNGNVASTGQINVAAGSTLNLTAGTLTLNGGTITLAAGTSSQGMLKLGPMQFTGSSTTGTIASGTVGMGQSPGYVDLAGATSTLTIGAGTQPAQVIISAPITDGGIVKSGAGTLELSGANTYSLGTTVTAGTLIADNTSGSATGTGNVTLNGGILASGATGSISGNVLSGTAAHTIAPGGVGTVGSLTIGGLTSTSLTTLNFDLGTGTGEITNGDLLTLGTGTVSIGSGTRMTFGGTPVVGNDYRLIGDTSGSGSVVDVIPLANFTLPAALAEEGFSLSTSVDANYIDLVMASGGSANLTWNNSGGNNLWDTATSSNWNNGTSNTVFNAQDNVTFNDNNPSNTTANYAVTLNTTVSPGSVVVSNSNGNYTISGAGGSIGGTGSLTKSGSGTLTLSTPNTYSAGTVVTAGRLLIEPTSSTTSALPTGALSISGSGIVQLADNVTAGTALGTSNVTLTSLSLTGAGTLDIGNNRIIIDYSSPATDPIASIESWISNGYYGVSGPAIISSDITADDATSGLSYGIGYADGADGTVAGLPSGEIEIMFTLLGDANLDGTVNSEDFTPFAANVGQPGVWDMGDFNYDGTVNAEDFSPFSHNIGQSASLAAAAGGLEAANGFNLANVPEPSCAMVSLIAAVSLLQPRFRSRKRDQS